MKARILFLLGLVVSGTAWAQTTPATNVDKRAIERRAVEAVIWGTRSGPVVLEIPAAEKDAVIVGSIDAAWQNALEDVGPAGADQGKGGKYLITPPGYAEAAPSGYFVLPSDTYQGFVILRSNFKSRSDAASASRFIRWARPRSPRPMWTCTTSRSTPPFRTTGASLNPSIASCRSSPG
jgi:hypothetical protein